MASGATDDPCAPLWQAAAEVAQGRSLFVLGVGFDPRSLVGLQSFLTDAAPLSPPLIVRIDLPPPSPASDPATRALAIDNLAAFAELAAESRVIGYPNVHERVNAGPRIARSISDPRMLTDIGHVVVDISALPSTIYFPLIAALLQASDTPDDHPAHFGGQLQVVACENPLIDAAITSQGIGGAAVVGGFRTRFERESRPSGSTIWVPTVGENCREELRAIHEFLNPEDTTPVLPFPARRPRRADDLIVEYQLELFDEFRVSAGNLIYADERNPFDLYRTLCRLSRDYSDALAAIGHTTVALSAHSSKLLSLGVLLAAYEQSLPIIAASTLDYAISRDVDLDQASRENEVAGLWLTGAPYE